MLGHGWFLNREALLRMPAKYRAVALEDGEVLTWDPEQLRRMTMERPLMASELARAASKQEMQEMPRHHEAEMLRHHGGKRMTPRSLTADSVSTSSSSMTHCNTQESQKVTACRAHFMRMQSSVHFDMDASCFLGQAGQPEEERFLPEELRVQRMQLDFAKELGDLGLFEYDADGFLPPLPHEVEKDLAFAFDVYATSKGIKVDDGSTKLVHIVKGEVVISALQFAGFFDMALLPEIPELRKGDFLKLGHEVAMSRLSEEQVRTLKELFAEYRDGDESVTEDMLKVLRKAFGVKLSFDEVAALASLWDHCSFAGFAGSHDEGRFVAAVSWLVMRLRQDWNAVVAHEALVRGAGAEELTAQALAGLLQGTTAEAMEMLYCANWRNAGADMGELLDRSDVLSAVALDATEPRGALPPCGADLALPCALGAGRCTEGLDVRAILWRPEVTDVAEIAPIYAQRLLPATSQNLSKTPKGVRSLGQRSITTAWDTATVAEMPVPSTPRGHVALVLEFPESSRLATGFALATCVTIVLSVLVMFAESISHSKFQKRADESDLAVWWSIELVFTVFFTIDWLVRVAVADALGTVSLRAYLLKPSTLCDLAATLPFYVELVDDGDWQFFRFARIGRLLRLFRLFRLLHLMTVAKLPFFRTLKKIGQPLCVLLVIIQAIYLRNRSPLFFWD